LFVFDRNINQGFIDYYQESIYNPSERREIIYIEQNKTYKHLQQTRRPRLLARIHANWLT
jgi:hypothetical protein